MSKLNIKTGDKVVVIAGKDKGVTGEVLSVLPMDNKVVVKGVNIQTHFNKPKSKDDKGGIVKKEGAIDISNVQVICPTCNLPTRIGRGVDESGKSVRICKHSNCGAIITTKVAKVKKTTKKSK